MHYMYYNTKGHLVLTITLLLKYAQMFTFVERWNFLINILLWGVVDDLGHKNVIFLLLEDPKTQEQFL